MNRAHDFLSFIAGVIKGDALSIGTSTIRIETSDGVSTSFQVKVVGAENQLVLSGPKELNCDGDSVMDGVRKTGIVSAKITLGSDPPESCIWTTSDAAVVSFDGGKDRVERKLNASGTAKEIKEKINITANAPGKEKKATITCRLSDGTSKTWTVKVYSDAERKIKALAEAWTAAYMQYSSAVETALKAEVNTSFDPAKLDAMAKKMEAKLLKNYGIELRGAEWNKEARIAACKALLEMISEQVITQCALKNIDPDSDTLSADIVNAVAESMNHCTHSYQEQDEDGMTSVNLSRFDFAGASTGQATYTYRDKDGRLTTETLYFGTSVKNLENLIKDFEADLCELNKAAHMAALKTAVDELSTALFGKDLKNLSVSLINSKLSQYSAEFKNLGVGSVAEMLIDCKSYYDTAVSYLMSGDFLESQLSSILSSKRNKTFSDPGIGSGQKEIKQAVRALDSANKDLTSALDEYLRTGKVSDKKKSTGLKAIFMCPVTVDIYKGGKKIGAINEDDTYCTDSDVTITQTAEVKTVYYSEPLTFELIGTDYGTLNCTFEETVNGAVTQRINYYDIPLYNGKEISAATTTPVVSENETASGTVTLTAGSESLCADATITLDAYADSSVQIDCPDVDGGSSLGADRYIAGDSVRMQAMADAGYSFLGWLGDSGTLVCLTPVYEFTAREDRTLTPLFAQDSAAAPAAVTISEVRIENGSTAVTLDDPDGILSGVSDLRLFAASYADERLEQVTAGTLTGTTAVFRGELRGEWSLFLLDGSFAPLNARLFWGGAENRGL